MLEGVVNFLNEFGYEFQVSAKGNPFAQTSMTVVDQATERRSMNHISTVPRCEKGHMFICSSLYDNAVFQDEWDDFSSKNELQGRLSVLMFNSNKGFVKLHKSLSLAA